MALRMFSSRQFEELRFSEKKNVSGVKTWSTLLGYDSSKFYSNRLRLTISGMEKQ